MTSGFWSSEASRCRVPVRKPVRSSFRTISKDLPSNKLPDTALNRLQNIDNKTCPLSNLLIRKSKAF